MIKTGLFFGSFNPVHVGHMIVANYMRFYTDLSELWLMVSPRNPHKSELSLWDDDIRLDLVRTAVADIPFLSVCDIEFSMPTPSFTIDTLTKLSADYPDREFVMVMGSDGLENFSNWKASEQIINEYTRYIYKRPGTNPAVFETLKNAKVFDAPLMDISSTFIRKALSEGKDIRCLLPCKVWDVICALPCEKKEKLGIRL